MGLIVGKFGFLNWWLVLFPLRIVEWGRSLVSEVTDVFAIKAMASHIGEAIFQDPTWQGRMIGIAIRIARISVGLVVMIITTVLVGCIMLGWYALPLVAILGVVQ